MCDVADSLLQKPVRLYKDPTGFILNRLQYACLREACHCVEMGYASLEDVDNVMKYGLACGMHALGPLRQWTSVVFTFSIMWAAICLTRCVMTAAYRKYRTRKSTGSILLSGNSAPDYPHQDRDLCQQHQRNSKQHEFSCNCKAYRCTKSEGVPSNRRDRHGAVSCKKSDPGAYSKAGGAFGRYECSR